MLLGGLLGTLPDMDVLVQYSDAVESFTYHRSWSHSLFVLSIISIPIAWMLMCFYPMRFLHKAPAGQTQSPSFAHWLVGVFLILNTHAILDGFTVYGTQLLWPMDVKPVAWASVFIIDPLYTVPLIVGLVIAYRSRALAKKAVVVALLVSTLYLGLTLLIQDHIRVKSVQALKSQNLGHHNVLIAPTPLSLLWRVVSVDGDQYYEGFTSVIDKTDDITFLSFDTNRDLIDAHAQHWPVARLDWFTSEMIAAERNDNQLIINDLRMGIESSYIFRFLVGQWNQNEFQALESVQLPVVIDTERMRLLLKRTWDENAPIEKE